MLRHPLLACKRTYLLLYQLSLNTPSLHFIFISQFIFLNKIVFLCLVCLLFKVIFSYFDTAFIWGSTRIGQIGEGRESVERCPAQGKGWEGY